MPRGTRALTPARRDAGIRRLQAFNRLLIGGTVVVTGLLTDVAANAFPGHKRAVGSSLSQPAGAAQTSGSHRRAHRAHHRRSAHSKLSAPAQAPTTAPGTSTAPPATAPAQTATALAQTATAPAQTATAPAQTATAPAQTATQAAPPPPAPVLSGGS